MSRYDLILEDARRDCAAIVWTFLVRADGEEHRWTLTTPERGSLLFDVQSGDYMSASQMGQNATTGDQDLDRALLDRCREEIARVRLARAIAQPEPRRAAYA